MLQGMDETRAEKRKRLTALRHDLAGRAMQVMLQKVGTFSGSQTEAEEIAANSYRIADTMLRVSGEKD